VTAEPVLSVRDLRTTFDTDAGTVKAVDGVSFEVRPSEVFAIVGESGSGKTVTCLSLLGLLPKPAGKVVGGEALYKGDDLLQMRDHELRKIRGNRIAMIFQDPLTALNPVFTVGSQIAEVFKTHRGESRRTAMRNAIGLLELVGIPEPKQRAGEYPHQFSGGMRQRAMIAMAVALTPDILIADEPTTALDATVQAQIMEVFLKVRDEFGMALILVTHDLGVVAGIAERVMVMYAGKVAESGSTEDIFVNPKHPYTWGLMASVPRMDEEKLHRLLPIRGVPPSLIHVPSGCPFHPRCDYSKDICINHYPENKKLSNDHFAACHFATDAGWAPRGRT
jgi:oligopeptide transport system ATP-binding protein